MAIWFNCIKCGELLTAMENKAGLVSTCPKCHAKNKIPGIAMQRQATKDQIEQMEMALKRLRTSLWILIPIIVYLVCFLFYIATEHSSGSFSIDSGGSLIGLGLIIGITIVVLVPTLKLCEYLGYSKNIQIFLFFFLSAIWVIMLFVMRNKLRTRIAYLKKSGIRSESLQPNSIIQRIELE
jgi:phage FluMu protein Com